MTATTAAVAGQAEQQVVAADDARLAAMAAMDLPALERLLADDLVYIHSSGKHDGKQAYLASLRSGHIHYHSLRRPATHVAVTGDLATLSGVVEITARVEGDERFMKANFLSAWIRREGHWLLLAINMVRADKT